eukprot:5530402-Amphidinium_carterae.1
MSSRSALGTVELPAVVETGALCICAVSVVMSKPGGGLTGATGATLTVPLKKELTVELLATSLKDSGLETPADVGVGINDNMLDGNLGHGVAKGGRGAVAGRGMETPFINKGKTDEAVLS